MSMKSLEDRRREVLEYLEKKFTDIEVPAKLSPKDENGVEVLGMILQDAAAKDKEALGEFFFMPVQEEDEIQFFVNLLTLTEELSVDHIGDLSTVVAAINTYISCGAFAIDYAVKSLIYKCSYEMSVDADTDEMKDNADISMGMAFQTVDQYGSILLEVNEGKKTAKEVMNIFYKTALS